MPESEPPKFDPARNLSLHLIGAEATFEMDVQGDRKNAVRQCPLDRSPVVGQQQIRSQVNEYPADAKKRGKRPPFVDPGIMDIDVQRRINAADRSRCAVERKDRMTVSVGKMVDHACYADRYAAMAK